MSKTLKFQSLALVTGLGLCTLISGCNPDEPATPPASPPAAVKTPPGPAKTDTKTPPPVVAPAKTETPKTK